MDEYGLLNLISMYVVVAWRFQISYFYVLLLLLLSSLLLLLSMFTYQNFVNVKRPLYYHIFKVSLMSLSQISVVLYSKIIYD